MDLQTLFIGLMLGYLIGISYMAIVYQRKLKKKMKELDNELDDFYIKNKTPE